MSQRRRLPNSLRWRAVGWMEMGLSQADVARRLNVRPVPGRPRATTPAEDRFLALSARRRRTTTVPQLVADHFQASGRRISATTVRNRLHNAGLYARRPVVCVPPTDDSEGTVYAGQENMFLGRSNNGLLAIDTINPTLLKDTVIEVVESWFGQGISLGGHTDLHVFHGGTVTGLRYRDEILDPYAAAIGNDFILMDDNARPHRARLLRSIWRITVHKTKRLPESELHVISAVYNSSEHIQDPLKFVFKALIHPKESDTKFLVKEISKFIHRFDLKEDISLYLKLFERQAQRLNIDQENWVSHLLGLLPTEVSHIIAREPDDKANSYEHVKDLLLKRFKLTPEKFRQLFVTHQKAPERTWIDFYHELNTYFNGWIDGLKIDTFNKLSDLIITDQLKRKLLLNLKNIILMNGQI
ncbi:transposable element Tcb2 transposase [Trichonephila clavipes]|nr:transposable element Tcb2 transposase [Trichonephila clavipes]